MVLLEWVEVSKDTVVTAIQDSNVAGYRLLDTELSYYNDVTNIRKLDICQQLE